MKNRSTVILILLMIFVLHGIPSNASRYVTVATIGTQVPAVDKSKGTQAVVNQITAFWHKKLNQVYAKKPDLIVLPEYCDIPKGMSREERSEYLLVRKNQIVDFFASEAKKNQCYIAFGMRREKDGIWYNSCIVVDRQGKVAGIYDKNFPTIGELNGGTRAGKQTPLIKCDFGTIGCTICFDLNFDELRLAYAGLKPDIIVFPSMYHGGLVQANWAFTCRSFFIGSMAFRETSSEIRNPLGEVIASSTNYFDYAVAKINLDRQMVHLDGNWEKLAGLQKKYGNGVTMTDAGELGSVLITSETEDATIEQMIKEFDIELLDDYFARSRKVRSAQVNTR